METLHTTLLAFESPLIRGTFVKRYKRFFVDMLHSGTGDLLTVHCANSGSMRSCLEDGAPALARDSGNPARKLRHSLELLELVDGYACLNTMRANSLVELFLGMASSGRLLDLLPSSSQELLAEDFSAGMSLRSEAKYSDGTRFDFLLENRGRRTWLEVKSVSLRLDPATLAFPDAVSARGQKHLRELMEAVAKGDDAFLLFVFMRGASVPADELVQGFRAAHEIDPAYAALLAEATKKGVKVRMLVPSITPEGFGVRGYFRFPH